MVILDGSGGALIHTGKPETSRRRLKAEGRCCPAVPVPIDKSALSLLCDAMTAPARGMAAKQTYVALFPHRGELELGPRG
jgi:hypothetical protein